MKIFIQTKKEIIMLNLLVALVTFFATYIIFLSIRINPIVINCKYNIDGTLDFSSGKYKISYKTED